MTTGNIAYGSKVAFANGFIGHWTTKSWTGADRPKIPKGSPRVTKRDLNATPHPYSCSIRETVSPPIRVDYYTWLGKWYYQSSGDATVEGSFGLQGIPSPWTANDDLKLLNKLRDNVVGGNGNLAVSLAEMGETLTTMRSVVKRVDKLLTHAATFADLRGKAKWRHARTLLRRAGRRKPIRTAANYWLEWRYAIRPFLFDIDGHCKTLANLNNRPDRTKYRASTYALDSRMGNFGMSITRKVTGRVLLEVTTQPKKLLMYTGVTDPGAVMYEKLPYSFVLDWFLPVGDFLRAIDLWRNVDGVYVFSKKDVQTCIGCFGNDGNRVVSGGGGYSRKSIDFVRTVSTNPTIPYPTFDGAIGKTATALKHCIDAVALFGVPRELEL